MTSYFCRSCGFKYTPRVPRTSPPQRCHNCGGLNTTEKEPDAEQIIKESNFG